MDARTLEGGFSDPAIQSAHAFRALMEAIARPGTVRDVTGAAPPAPLSVAAGVALLTLCDGDTPLHLAGDADCPEVRAWTAFHTGAPLVDAAQCMFAVGRWEALSPLNAYAIGTPEYPDRSATLIVDHAALDGPGMRLTGPGIRHEARLVLPDAGALADNAALFPLGCDLFFCDGSRIAALPRSTRIDTPDKELC
jgi:alpha-D-ribose 1-methylphosphonate 5-triphosphate synthase subunit PhnH